MLTRVCAGGVVFQEDRVFILKNDKGEWVLPKGVVRSNEMTRDVALRRVKHEGGVEAEVISPAGETNYEFYSYSRKMPVCNIIDWFIMEATTDNVSINKEEGFQDGGFFPIDEAVDKITYSQDKSLIRLAYKKYQDFRKMELAATAG
ncbi:MAG: NUDIX hydrolase [Peptococcaceae bacterium]|jgi:ADP-ribose pyrophosphatase YjhB (NUDIX family)|nr:NUDIX hydrolase [Peptococcaceae bacterium]MDH7524843.1 NUDIX hydrolase [Peptococcaceae bacterium]